MTREQLERNLGSEVKLRLFDGTVITGVLRKTGESDFKNDPNLYIPKNYYFVTEKGAKVILRMTLTYIFPKIIIL